MKRGYAKLRDTQLGVWTLKKIRVPPSLILWVCYYGIDSTIISSYFAELTTSQKNLLKGCLFKKLINCPRNTITYSKLSFCLSVSPFPRIRMLVGNIIRNGLRLTVPCVLHDYLTPVTLQIKSCMKLSLFYDFTKSALNYRLHNYMQSCFSGCLVCDTIDKCRITCRLRTTALCMPSFI